MLSYINDRIQTAVLRARYRRRIHERLLELTEASGPLPVADDAGRWAVELRDGTRLVASRTGTQALRERLGDAPRP